MEELILKDVLQIIIKKKWIILIAVVLFLFVGSIYTYKGTTPMYKASTTLVLAKSGEQDEITETSITQTELNLNSKLVATYSELIKSKSVIREVLSNLNIGDLKEDTLRKSIQVKAVNGTEIIEITVSSTNYKYTAVIANEISRVFTQKVEEIYNINNVFVVDAAEESREPYNINHKKNIMMFVFAGILISGLYIVGIYIFDNTIKTDQDIEVTTGLLVLGSIPEHKTLNKEAKFKWIKN